MAPKRLVLAFVAGLAFFISCSVGKLLDAPPNKVIGVTPSRVVVSMPAQGAAPRDTQLAISATTGDGPRPWTAHLAGNAQWLTFEADTGSAPGTLGLTLDPTGLATGTHRDTVVIVPNDRGIAQVRVPVELQILAAASRLTFSQQPTTTAARATITPAVEVRALDADGQPFTGFSGTITIALGSHPTGAALSGNLTASASGGVARFSNLGLDKVGSYTLTAAAQGLTGATSASFDITPGPASRLRFTVQPSNTQQNRAITPPVEVTALDDGGNVVTAFTGDIAIAIARDASPLQNAQLGGRRTVAAAAGVATFGDLTLDQVGIGYTLTVTAAGLSGATSEPFDISALAPPPPPPPPATHLEFSSEPPTTLLLNGTFSVEVTARDANGNTATTFSGPVSLMLEGPVLLGGLSGDTNQPAVNGVATLSNLRITGLCTGCSLKASAPGLTGATSRSFSVLAL